MRIIEDVAIVLIFLNVLNFGDGENRGFCTMEDDCMELEYCEMINSDHGLCVCKPGYSLSSASLLCEIWRMHFEDLYIIGPTDVQLPQEKIVFSVGFNHSADIGGCEKEILLIDNVVSRRDLVNFCPRSRMHIGLWTWEGLLETSILGNWTYFWEILEGSELAFTEEFEEAEFVLSRLQPGRMRILVKINNDTVDGHAVHYVRILPKLNLPPKGFIPLSKSATGKMAPSRPMVVPPRVLPNVLSSNLTTETKPKDQPTIVKEDEETLMDEKKAFADFSGLDVYVADNQDIYLPNSAAVLVGNSRSDRPIVSQYWQEVTRKGRKLIFNVNDSRAFVYGLEAGIHQFRFHVLNEGGVSGTSDMFITVHSDSGEAESVCLVVRRSLPDITQPRLQKLSRWLGTTLAPLVPDSNGTVNVHFTNVVEDFVGRRLHIHFYADYPLPHHLRPTQPPTALFDVKKPAVEDRALVKAVNVVKIVRDNIHHPLLREFDVSMVYANRCFLQCSGHGTCNLWTTQCDCDPYWMPNTVRWFLTGRREDCDWPSLYLLFFVVVGIQITGRLLPLAWHCVGRLFRPRKSRTEDGQPPSLPNDEELANIYTNG